MNDLTKVCRGCLLELPASGFYKKGDAVGGGIILHSRCKNCHLAYMKEHSKKPGVKERCRLKEKEYRKKPGVKEKISASYKKYLQNPEIREKRLNYMKDYKERPGVREKLLDLWRKYHEKHKEKRNAYNKEYYSRKKLEKELVK